ncbi:SipW-dependent-type signal peptide-containing protein [Clostridium swellfunianum]|uniref:SipW-dependent-type signal peptide-containing protein n=1 Tax=Clostridium swellfunianum TaxID=1367462 RepID=UPI00202E0E64|nr:SipW-dependent-type signal peptide-containing protein [Clostridium swellfunianum]MCM0649314.1 SipW-dependent-type signal peptide-containing protein [Clostridium swellfunianum]
MKKSRILTAAVVAAMVSLGAGYAAWTDALTINNTVSTGTLDVDFVGGGVVWNADNANVAFGTASGSENTATIDLDNLYPGAVATVTLPVKNNGTIPVKNGTFTFSNVPSWLTVSTTSQPTLAVTEQKNVTITMTVGENAPQTSDATFTATAVYQQFNK